MAALLDKLRVPHMKPDQLRRVRLWDRLDDAGRRRAIVVAAPAGFGKTTACASWINEGRGPGKVAWLTLDRGDADRGRFWECVRDALGGFGPDLPAGLDDAAYEPFLTSFLTELAAAAGPFTLVLDDMHEVVDSPVMTDVEFVLRHAPPGLHLVLVGRRMPNLQAARLRLAGELEIITADELACSPGEARELQRLGGVRVTDDELEALMQRTEGWIAGLRLELIGGEVVRDYIREEFLDDFAPAVRNFLRRTSVVDTFTADLADELAGTADSAHLLELVSREQGFIKHEETAGRASYRYHPMVRAVLRAELECYAPGEVSDLVTTVGRWHTRHGRPMNAFECALAADDHTYLSQVLDNEDIGLLTGERGAQVVQALLELPVSEYAACPAIAAAAAAARLRHGDLADAEEALDHGLRSAVGHRRRTDPLRIKFAALRLALAIQTGTMNLADLDAAWRSAELPADLPSGQAIDRAHGWLTLLLGVCHLVRDELHLARWALRLAERDFGRVGPAHLHERARGWLALADAVEGQLAAAMEQAERVGESSPGRGLAQIARARVLLERGDPLAAGEALATEPLWPDEPLFGEPTAAFVTQSLTLAVCQASGDLTGAGTAYTRMREAAGPYSGVVDAGVRVADLPDDSDVSVEPPAAHHAVLQLARQPTVPAEMAPPERGPEGAQTPVWITSHSLARAWRDVDRDVASALQIVQRCLADEHRLRLRDVVTAHLVSAVSYRRLGDRDRASRELEAALALAEPEGLRQVFVEGGKGVRVLLTVGLPVESRFAGFRAELLQRFERAIVAPALGPSVGELTQSEQAVLRFLPSHMTNEEIAAELYLSVNTVKTHLRAIYRKLGVHNRRTAIAAANQSGLLLSDPADRR